MSIFLDLWHTNLKVAKKTFYLSKDNPKLFLLGIPYMIILLIASRIAIAAGIFAGLILLLIQSAIISDYLFILNKLLRTGKFDIEDFKSGFRVYFRKVYISLFFIRVVYLGVDIFLDPFRSVKLMTIMILNIVAFVLLNPLLEVIYQKRLTEMDSFKYSIQFVKENWFDWFIPNSVLLALSYGLYKLIVINVMRITYVSQTYAWVIIAVLFAILSQILIGYGMVYRGCLFDLLSKTTRRKRIFTRHLH